MEEKDLSLLYRPDINIERDYRSDGTILHELPTNEPEVPQQIAPDIPDEITKAVDTAKNTVEKLIRIRKITPVLPTLIQPTINDLLDTVIIWTANEVPKLEKIQQEEEEKPDEEKHEVPGTVSDEGTPEPEQSDDEWPTMTSSGFIFDVQKNKDVWDMARDQYLLDSVAIQEDFADEFNNVMEGYVYQLVSAMDEVGLDAPEYLNYEYEGETVTGIPANYLHLNDIIVKNQDVVNEYADIFRKTHDEFETYRVLASYDVAAQKRIRYLKEKYKDGTAANYIEMYDKNYLGKSRDGLEKIYVDARTNVYKMLHSACQITKETLDAQLELAISKCSLLAKEINIFAKKEYENAAYENSTAGKIKSVNASSNTTPVNDTTKKPDTASKANTEVKTDTKNSVKNVQEQTKPTSAIDPNKKAEQKGQSV